MSYETTAEKIKEALDSELGITFSIGLAPTKVLAKLGSKWKKPSGLTIIHKDMIPRFLDSTAIGKIWGIGYQTESFLLTHGIKTALQFIEKPDWWIREKLTKPHQEIWRELRGESVLNLTTEEKDDYQSISKTKTFTPPSSEKEFVFAELSKNIENACIKARRHGLVSKAISFFLKTQDFKQEGIEIKLSRDTNIPKEMIDVVQKSFDSIFKKGTLYRSTGVVLGKLSSSSCSQPDLFGGTLQADAMNKAYQQIDRMDAKYGKHTIFLGSSFQAIKNPSHLNERGEKVSRVLSLFKGETNRRHIGIPMLGEVS